MKGAIGNTMVMNIVLTFVVLTTALLVGSISYSKAYKIKTKVIDIIEKHDGSFSSSAGNQILAEIDSYLGSIGYRTSNVSSKSLCDSYKSEGETVHKSSNYDICIIEKNSNSNGYQGEYYKVVVFMYFDFPVIGDSIKIPVSGETKSLFKPVN